MFHLLISKINFFNSVVLVVRNQRNVVFQYLHTSSNNFTPQNCAILYQGMISSHQYSLFKLVSFHPKQVRLSHNNTPSVF